MISVSRVAFVEGLLLARQQGEYNLIFRCQCRIVIGAPQGQLSGARAARNLFPEASESGGVDYRLNLITVPSCDAHNSAKSNDDEFLMVSLAGIFGSNSIGFMHRLGKVDRAISIVPVGFSSKCC